MASLTPPPPLLSRARARTYPARASRRGRPGLPRKHGRRPRGGRGELPSRRSGSQGGASRVASLRALPIAARPRPLRARRLICPPRRAALVADKIPAPSVENRDADPLEFGRAPVARALRFLHGAPFVLAPRHGRKSLMLHAASPVTGCRPSPTEPPALEARRPDRIKRPESGGGICSRGATLRSTLPPRRSFSWTLLEGNGTPRRAWGCSATITCRVLKERACRRPITSRISSSCPSSSVSVLSRHSKLSSRRSAK